VHSGYCSDFAIVLVESCSSSSEVGGILCPPDATSVTVTLGSESHYLLACPSITPKLEPHYEPIKRLLKRLALPPWEQISEPEKISLLLGGSLPPHWKTSKTQREQWRNRCSNHSALLALKLSSLLTSLPTTVQSA
jgi:hypothetical protein